MREKDTGFRSTPDRVLEQAVTVLAQVDEGAPFQSLIEAGENGRIVQNSVLAILRHRAVIDWITDRCAARPVRPRLRRVLRWGVAQMLYLHGLASAAATDTCVRFVRRKYSVEEAGFVNAVLRRIAGQAPEPLLAEVQQHAPTPVRLELGEVLYRQWSPRRTPEELEELCRILLEPAPLTVRLRAGAPLPELPFLTPLAPLPWAPSARMWV